MRFCKLARSRSKLNETLRTIEHFVNDAKTLNDRFDR